jgi:4'-phosphopantetheinyl transferase
MTVALAKCLPRSHVHVWHCDLLVPDTRLHLYRPHLRPGERLQAQAIASASARRRFIVRRAFRRIVISKYLRLSARKVIFRRGSDGKPFVVGNRAGLNFSCSHSGELAVIALSRSAEIGIDLERKRLVREMDGIARLFSFPSASLSRDADAIDADTFFLEWTRLEASAKYLGLGLSKFDRAKVDVPVQYTICLSHRDEDYALSIARKGFSKIIARLHRFDSDAGQEIAGRMTTSFAPR